MNDRLRLESEVERLRKRWNDPAFEASRRHLLARADTALTEGLRPADRGAGWGHAYYCPDHAVPLAFDPAAPHRHRCPVDGVQHEGEIFDGGWRCALNGRILGGLQACALAWRASGNPSYREHAAATLAAYAELYPRLPARGEHVGLGRVTGQSLEEAVWAIGIARSFDDLRDSLAPGELHAIRTDLLAELGRHLIRQLMGKIHNIECWHLAALATLGTVLDDEDLLSTATEGDHALPAQLAEGILDDGWWAEGSPNYHYYMLASVLHAATALRVRDPGFLAGTGLRSMLTAPLSLMRADLSLPALNDGWNSMALPLGMAQYASHYEQAYGLWHEQVDEDFLREVYGRGTRRTSEHALTMGPDLTTCRTPSPRARRLVHPASGYAVLADGEGIDERFLLVKYGPHGGGHGHPDKLQLDLHAFGVRLAPDAGSPAYNSPLQGPWFRQSLSHNTVVLGEESQPEAEGRLLDYRDPRDAGAGLIDAAVSWPVDPSHAPGPHGYYVDLVLVEAGGGTSIDLAWHHRGRLAEPERLTPTAPPWAQGSGPYDYLDDTRMLGDPDDREWSARWEVEGAGTRMWGLDPPGGRAVTATSPSNPPSERQATLLRRATGPRVAFATVIEPHRIGGGSIRSVRWRDRGLVVDGGPLEFDVEQRSGHDRWQVRMAAGPTSVTVDAGSYRIALASQT